MVILILFSGDIDLENPITKCQRTNQMISKILLIQVLNTLIYKLEMVAMEIPDDKLI